MDIGTFEYHCQDIGIGNRALGSENAWVTFDV